MRGKPISIATLSSPKIFGRVEDLIKLGSIHIRCIFAIKNTDFDAGYTRFHYNFILVQNIWAR